MKNEQSGHPKEVTELQLEINEMYKRLQQIKSVYVDNGLFENAIAICYIQHNMHVILPNQPLETYGREIDLLMSLGRKKCKCKFR
jgi:hypothetical protein